MSSFRTSFSTRPLTRGSPRQNSRSVGRTYGFVRRFCASFCFFLSKITHTVADETEIPSVGAFELDDKYETILNKTGQGPWFRSENGKIAAGLEVHHNLHCLDMIRQYTYKDEYDYTQHATFWNMTDVFIRKHLDHCIDALRIRLMWYVSSSHSALSLLDLACFFLGGRATQKSE